MFFPIRSSFVWVLSVALSINAGYRGDSFDCFVFVFGLSEEGRYCCVAEQKDRLISGVYYRVSWHSIEAQGPGEEHLSQRAIGAANCCATGGKGLFWSWLSLYFAAASLIFFGFASTANRELEHKRVSDRTTSGLKTLVAGCRWFFSGPSPPPPPNL